MKKLVNEKLSTVATAAIAALINNRITGLKKQVQSLSKDSTKAKSDTQKSEKDIARLDKSIKDLTTQIKSAQKEPASSSNKKEELNQIRKLIRKEVSRILFDIYKLRNTWTTT